MTTNDINGLQPVAGTRTSKARPDGVPIINC